MVDSGLGPHLGREETHRKTHGMLDSDIASMEGSGFLLVVPIVVGSRYGDVELEKTERISV